LANPTLILNRPFPFVGLGTLTYTVATTGLYNAQAQCTETPPSGLSIVVQQNGTTVYTAPTVTATQSALQFKTELNCSATDVITVVMSSSTAIDKQLNTVKTTVTIGQGL
jgi:hypothetical protein